MSILTNTYQGKKKNWLQKSAQVAAFKLRCSGTSRTCWNPEPNEGSSNDAYSEAF